jgi:hypothetical protein
MFTQVVGFEIFTVVVMKNTVFWNITQCSPSKVNRRFRGLSPQSSGSKNKPNFLQNSSTIYVIIPIMLFDLSDIVLNCSSAYVPARIGCRLYTWLLPTVTHSVVILQDHSDCFFAYWLRLSSYKGANRVGFSHLCFSLQWRHKKCPEYNV